MCHPQHQALSQFNCASPSVHLINQKALPSTPVSKRVVQPPEQFAIYKRAKEEQRRDTHNQIIFDQTTGQSHKSICRRLVFDDSDDDSSSDSFNFQIQPPNMNKFGQP